MSAKTRGFTLLEVMVALAILAIALSAAIRTSSNATRSASDLQQRTAAEWIVANQIATLRATRAWPDVGVTEGETSMLGETFYWRQVVGSTPAPIFRRVEVTANIVKDDQRFLAKLTTLLARQ